MQRYENYKSSGIQWVQHIPVYWNVERAKWIFNRAERPVRPEDDVVTAFRDGQVTLRTNRRTEGFTNAIQEHGYQGIRKGDLVIHAMDAFAGAIGVSDSDGKSTPVYAACIPRGEYGINSYFYAYLLRYMAHSGYIESLSKGIRERSTDFRFAEFRELSLPIPPRAEQDRIVNFLDQKTAEIDTAIAKKQRLIELLQEQKSILINQAVTRGLNPNVAMRDSGNKWIGLVPSHWSVKRLKYQCQRDAGIQMGPFGTMLTNLSPVPTKFALFGQQNTISGDFCNVSRWLNEKTFCALEKYAALPGDIVTTRKGSIGNCRLIPDDIQPGIIDSDTIRIRVNKQVLHHKFLQLLLHEAQYVSEMISFGKRGAVVSGLNTSSISNLELAFPPFEEQIEILSTFEQIKTNFNPLEQVIHSEISELKHLKSVLVANSVTGNIKI